MVDRERGRPGQCRPLPTADTMSTPATTLPPTASAVSRANGLRLRMRCGRPLPHLHQDSAGLAAAKMRRRAALSGPADGTQRGLVEHNRTAVHAQRRRGGRGGCGVIEAPVASRRVTEPLGALQGSVGCCCWIAACSDPTRTSMGPSAACCECESLQRWAPATVSGKQTERPSACCLAGTKANRAADAMNELSSESASARA